MLWAEYPGPQGVVTMGELTTRKYIILLIFNRDSITITIIFL